MPGQHLPPDPSAGDPNTIGGYMAVHGRPAAFEGRDGMSWSVAIETEETNDPQRPWGAYFLFLRWRRIGNQGVEGHLETEFLVWGATALEAREALGRWPLSGVLEVLNARIVADGQPSAHRWWDVMREDA